MEIKKDETVPVTVDLLCDVCSESTTCAGASPQYGTLSAHWSYGSQHDGERYEVQLCEHCFFRTLSGLRREHMVSHMFDDAAEVPRQPEEVFGLVDRGNYFKD